MYCFYIFLSHAFCLSVCPVTNTNDLYHREIKWPVLYLFISKNKIEFNKIEFNKIEFNKIEFNKIEFNKIEFNKIELNKIELN